jgi:hypothetical protein
MGISKEQAERALQGTFGSGAGMFDELNLVGGPRGANFWINRKSKSFGRYIEGYVRMGMALDTVLDGGSLDSVIGRINRYQFNYSEVSKLDRKMRRVVPFWTFMSRNLPLQVQTQWTRPKAYAAYNSFVRNMRDEEGDEIVPLTWEEIGAWEMGGPVDDWFAAPDLPFVRVEEMYNQATTEPQRLLSQVSPWWRVPFETQLSDKRLYNDQPFGDYVDDTWLQKIDFLDVLKLLGLEQEAGNGTDVISDRVDYGFQQMVPLLSQLERLFPTQDMYKNRRAQSTLSYFGVPIRPLTETMEANELRRRRFDQERIQDAIRQLATYDGGN